MSRVSATFTSLEAGFPGAAIAVLAAQAQTKQAAVNRLHAHATDAPMP